MFLLYFIFVRECLMGIILARAIDILYQSVKNLKQDTCNVSNAFPLKSHF